MICNVKGKRRRRKRNSIIQNYSLQTFTIEWRPMWNIGLLWKPFTRLETLLGPCSPYSIPYILVFVYVYVCVCCVYLYTCVHVYIRMCICTRMCVYTRKYKYIYTRICTPMCSYVYVVYIVCICMCTFLYIREYIRVHACVYADTCEYVYTRVCMWYVCMFEYGNVRTWECAYAYVCVCVCVYSMLKWNNVFRKIRVTSIDAYNYLFHRSICVIMITLFEA